MQELSLYLNKKSLAQKYHSEYLSMKNAINQYCWDGKWYIRAFDDRGKPIGSKKNKQGKIFLNTQSWAMISQIVPKDRAKVILNSIKKYLYTPYGPMLLWPTYTQMQKNIGRITCLEPGCSENASVYTHGAAFLALGLVKLNFIDEAFDVIKRILPYNPKNHSSALMPYQLSNGYRGPAHRYEPGRAQYGWVTGSGSWLYLTVIDYIFGARKTYDGILIQPKFPSHWNKAYLRRTYRGCVYDIFYKRINNKNKILKINVNNKEHNPEHPLPILKTKRKIKVEVLF